MDCFLGNSRGAAKSALQTEPYSFKLKGVSHFLKALLESMKLSTNLNVVDIIKLCNSLSLSFFCHLLDDGPCLGSRKPKQPYEWMSYSEVTLPISRHSYEHMTGNTNSC